MNALKVFIIFICCGFSLHSFAQDSTTIVVPGDAVVKADDTAVVKNPAANRLKHEPKKATFRSAVLPGWGQAYNREYWKIPVVWGALGTAAGIWIYNNTWYHRTRDAYLIMVNNETSRYGEIHKRLKNDAGVPLDANSLQFYRNEFRKNRDYSTLWFVILWGLNVVDATVFAHLKEFDVSDDLSMRISPSLNPANKTAGFTLAFNLKPSTATKALAGTR